MNLLTTLDNRSKSHVTALADSMNDKDKMIHFFYFIWLNFINYFKKTSLDNSWPLRITLLIKLFYILTNQNYNFEIIIFLQLIRFLISDEGFWKIYSIENYLLKNTKMQLVIINNIVTQIKGSYIQVSIYLVVFSF